MACMRPVPPLALGLRVPSRGSRYFLASSCAVLCALASPAMATTGTWQSQSDSDWGTPGNWVGGVIPNAVGDVAIIQMNFTAGIPGQHITLGANRTIGSLQAGDTVLSGAVTLGGNLQVSIISGYNPQPGDTFFVLLNDGTDAINGAFANAPGGHYVIPGYDFAVNYAANGDGGGVGNDIALTVVPEPTSAMLLLGGLAMMARRRRRP